MTRPGAAAQARVGGTVRRRLAGLRSAPERGSAVVEFVGAGVVLLVPLVYLVLTLAEVQAGAFATEAAAREAGRILAASPTAHERAARAVELAFADHGFEVSAGDVLAVTCEAESCAEPGSRIEVDVVAAVPLPMVPDVVREAVPAQVRLTATHVAVVDRFLEQP